MYLKKEKFETEFLNFFMGFTRCNKDVLIDYYLTNILIRYESRPYHNIDHILSGLNIINLFQNLEFGRELKCAWFMHDVIVGCANAELLSAAFTQQFICDLSLVLKEEIVYNLINETTIENGLKNQSQLEIPESDLIHDIDFMILGEDWETFLNYDNNIKKEYGPLFNKQKRIEFLSKVLIMKSIYRSKYFIEKYEQNAHFNINKILKEKYEI